MKNIFELYEFKDIVRYAMAIIVILTGLLAIAYSIWGGFLMIISAGDEEKVKKAVNVIRYAIVGIVVLVLIIFAFPFLFGLLGIPYADYTKPPVVFLTIRELSGQLFGNTSSTYDQDNSNTGLPADFSNL